MIARRGQTWIDKPRELRRANSRENKRVLIGEETWRKWCENCGNEYETVNEDRKLCDRCHEKKVRGKGYPPLDFGPSKHHGEPTPGKKPGGTVEYFSCPFCGKPAASVYCWTFDRGRGSAHDLFYARCPDCGAVGEYQETIEKAKEAITI